MPRKKTPAPPQDDYIIFPDGRTMPMPVWEQLPDWLTPARLKKPVGAAISIDGPRGRKRTAQQRAS